LGMYSLVLFLPKGILVHVPLSIYIYNEMRRGDLTPDIFHVLRPSTISHLHSPSYVLKADYTIVESILYLYLP
jgi:hypothetical protein